MSRKAQIEVRHVVEGMTLAGSLHLRIETLYNGDVQSAKHMHIDMKDESVRKALLAAGWLPPQVPVKATDEIEIGRRLDVIRAENPRVNLSYVDGDRILIGGVVNSKELRALAQLMETVR